MARGAAEPGRRPRIRSPFLRWSIGLHLAAPLAVLAAPGWWRVAAGAVVADHLLLVGASLWPRSRLLGPNLTRLPPAGNRRHVALTFDDGPDPRTTPAVLELLQQAGARASFFCIGRLAERHPGIVRDIVRAGHTVENHTHSHSNAFAFLPPRPMAAEIDRAQQALERLAGRRPCWFRAPAGFRNPWLDPLLAARGLELASWTRRGFDTVTADPRRVLGRLTAGLHPGAVLLLHDGGSATGDRGRPVVLEVLPALLDALGARDLRAVALPEPGPPR